MILIDNDGHELGYIGVPFVPNTELGDVICIPEKVDPFPVIETSDTVEPQTLTFIGVRIELRTPPGGGRREPVAVLVSGAQHLDKFLAD